MSIQPAHKRYFISQYSFEDYRHGGIGYSDAEKIMEEAGYAPIELPAQTRFSVAAKLARFFYILRIARRIPAGTVVVFIFPVYARMTQWLLKLLRKKARLVCFVGDIDGIKDGDAHLLQNEIDELKKYDLFIAHNVAMKTWLQQQTGKQQIAVIEFFDFLAMPFTGNREQSSTIVFAGNLAKSPFITELHKLPALHFNLYGPGITEEVLAQNNTTYFGIEKPYDLPALLQGGYGLLWDSYSIDEPAGPLGAYMPYISHHKLSLYILAGLPLIVPAIAASASLVTGYGIGITIHSLHEIEERIRNISAAQYHQMRLNMQPLAERISRGEGIKEALRQLLKG